MPHQPRSFAPTFGDSPPGPNQPTTGRPEGENQRKSERPQRQKIIGEPLSLKTYEPDPELVVRALFGKEIETDARTGQLVPAEHK